MRFKIIAIAVVCLLLGGGIAYAAGPAAEVTIQACYNNFTLGLRVSKSGECAPYETPLAWNQAGPAGPKGDPGPQGVPGPKGDQGTPGISSDAYIQRIPDTDHPAGTIGFLQLPPGSYTLQAKASVRPVDARMPASGLCWMNTAAVGGTSNSANFRFNPSASGEIAEGTISMLDAASASSSAPTLPLLLVCSASNTRLTNIVLIATKVGTLH